jgi:hypothetical protein
MPPVFGWPVYTDSSVSYPPTFTGGSWQATLPLTNLLDRQLARVTRSTDALATSTTFDVDLSAAPAIGLLALPKHSLTPSATVRWLASSTAGNFSSPIYDSGVLAVWPPGVTEQDMYGLNLAHVHIPPTPQTARHWRCAIVDTANPAGYIELARLILAGAWYPTTRVMVGAKLGLESETERIVSDGGAAFYRQKPMRRSWDFTLSMMTENESMATAFKLSRQVGAHRQLFFVFDSADTYMHERAFLCVMRELSAVEYPFVDYQSVAFRLVEEL